MKYSEGTINLERALNLAKGRKSSQKVANLAVNDTVTDNVNDTDNVNVSTIVDDGKKIDAGANEFPESDLLKNPEAEKEKSSAKKENRNDGYAEILKSPESESWLETVAMQNRRTADEILLKIDEFVVFLTTVDKEHASRRDFLEHFINWLKKNIDKPPQQGYQAPGGKPKFSINQ